MMKKNGFTLTELMIVVVIVGLLAAIAIPRYVSQMERGFVAEAVQMLSAIRQAEVAWSLEQITPAYTTNLADLDIDPSFSTEFTYTIAVTAGVAAAPPAAAVSPTFTATATRQAACTGQCCPSKTITITNAPVVCGSNSPNVFCGTHPYGPNPVAGATC
jgi:prepilin-type N-terminal cleavage/methylation domain-containing protein